MLRMAWRFKELALESEILARHLNSVLLSEELLHGLGRIDIGVQDRLGQENTIGVQK